VLGDCKDDLLERPRTREALVPPEGDYLPRQHRVIVLVYEYPTFAVFSPDHYVLIVS